MRRPMSLTSQGAGGALSSPSPKSSREFKHKPICERIFCLSVIHFSVGLPSQTSGVLLAFKLACVSIRRTDRLSIVKGMRCCCCFLFFFLAFLLWGEVAVHVSFQYLQMLWGHISTATLQLLAVGPRTHLREERGSLSFLR